MSCVYTYKNVEYKTREELTQAVLNDYMRGEIQLDQTPEIEKNLHLIEGTPEEIEVKKIMMEQDAINEFGTKEFITYYERGDKTYVHFDRESINDLTSGEKILFNLNTQQEETVSIEDLAKEYKRTQQIPNYRHAELYLELYFLDQIEQDAIDSYNRDRKQTQYERPSDGVLMDRLMDFANQLGISVTSLENYKQAFKLRTGENITVEALADTMRKIIAISNKDDVKQLTEEVAHFAIEYFADEEIMARMLENIPNTTKYKQEANRYRAVFGAELSGDALEQRIRKEILGKILADRITDNFNEETATNSSERGIIYQLKRLWERIKNLFTRKDSNKAFFKEFGKILDDIAVDVTSVNTQAFVPRQTNAIYYSASDESNAFREFLNESLTTLYQQYKSIHQDSDMVRERKESAIRDIRESIIKNQYYYAASEFIDLLEEDITQANSKIKDIEAERDEFERNNPNETFKYTDHVGNVELQNLVTFTSGVESMLRSLFGLFDSGTDVLSNRDIRMFKTRIKDLERTYNNIEPTLKEIKDEEYLNIIERVLNVLGIHGPMRDRLINKFKKIERESNWVATYIFSALSIANNIVQLIAAKVMQADTKAQMKSLEVVQKMRELQLKHNFTSTQIESLYAGHHIIAPFKYSEFEAEYKNRREEVQNGDIPQDILDQHFANYNINWDGVDKSWGSIMSALHNNQGPFTGIPQNERDLIELDLDTRLQDALLDLESEMKILPKTESYYQRMRRYHYMTKNILAERAAIRERVLSKYKDPDGRINPNIEISKEDLSILQAANATVRSYMSEYDNMGYKKPKNSKTERIAKELQEYLSFDGSDIVYHNERFQEALENAKDRFGEGTPEFANWVRMYAIQTYPDEVWDMLGRVGAEQGLLVDPGETDFRQGIIEIESIVQNLGLIDPNQPYDQEVQRIGENYRIYADVVEDIDLIGIPSLVADETFDNYEQYTYNELKGLEAQARLARTNLLRDNPENIVDITREEVKYTKIQTELKKRGLWQLLRSKSKQLLAPYKQTGLFNEYEGDKIDGVLQGLDEAVRDIGFYLKQIETVAEEERDPNVRIETKGNKAWERKWFSFTEESKRQQWRSRHTVTHPRTYMAEIEQEGQIRIVEIPVPDTPYYRTFRISRVVQEAQEVFERGRRVRYIPEVVEPYDFEYLPNYLWIDQEQDIDGENPNFNKSFTEKAVIPNHLNQNYFENGQSEWIDDRYFELFGINKDDVIGPNARTQFVADADGTVKEYPFGVPTRNKELYELYQELLKIKETVDNEYGLKNKIFQLPQVEADKREIAKIGAGKTIKAVMKRAFTLDLDDEEFGDQTNKQRIVGSVGSLTLKRLEKSKIIPKRYVEKLGDSAVISRNISRIYGMYAQAGYEFTERMQVLPEISILRDRIASSGTLLKRWLRKPVAGAQSNTLKIIDDWLDANLYGHAHDPGLVLDIDIGNFHTSISSTKLIKQIYRYISKVNLAYNIFVPVVGFINAESQLRVEAVAGAYATTKSMNWASLETGRLMAGYITSAGSINPDSKLKKLFEYTGLNINRNQLFDGIYNTKLYRLADTQTGYLHYNAFGAITGGQSLLSVLDNTRLYSGEVKEAGQVTQKTMFVNYHQFKEIKKSLNPQRENSDIEREWRTLDKKRYLDFLVDEKDKVLRLNDQALIEQGFLRPIEGQGLSEEEINQNKAYNSEIKDGLNTRVFRTVRQFHNIIEGLVAPEDRNALQRKTFGMFVTMHRGWFQSALQNRFKGEVANLYTGQIEEGSYRTLGRLVFEGVQNPNGNETLRGMFNYFKTFGFYAKALERINEQTGERQFEEYEIANLKRLMMDFYLFMGGLALYLILNAAADDDEDNYIKQYFGYVGSRVFAEIQATQLPHGLSEFYTIMQSPLAGVGLIEDMINLPGFFIDIAKGDVVKTGAYAGLKQWQKRAIKFTPMKNLWEPAVSNARKSNLFFRTRMIMTWRNELLMAVERGFGIREPIDSPEGYTFREFIRGRKKQ